MPRDLHNVDPTKLINWFDDFAGENKYRFLSNFYIGEPIWYRDYSFQTGEHLFAALKAADRADFLDISHAADPQAAKSRGRRIQLRPDWEAVKLDVMRLVLARKFHPAREEAQMLLDTGDAQLVEGTYWHDQVWGVDITTGIGRNWLGTLLMARRAELRAGGPFVGHAADLARFVTPEFLR